MSEKWRERVITILISLGVFFTLAQISTGGLIFKKFFTILTPLIYGGLAAIILNVIMSGIEGLIEKIDKKNKLPKVLVSIISLLITLLVIALVIYLLIIIVVPRLSTGVQNIINTININWDKIVEFCNNIGIDSSKIKNLLNQLDTSKIIDFAGKNVKTVFNTAIKTVSSLSGGVFTTVISLVCCIYILYGKDKLSSQLKRIITAYFPEKAASFIIDTGSLFNKTFKHFLTRQCLEALILGTILTIAMLIFRIPFALIVGAITAVLALIPYVGAFLSCVIGAFLILLTDPPKLILFIILFLVIQQIEGNLIYPHIVGKSVGLPAIWTLIAVYAGGELFGIIGMFLFVPIVSVIYTLIRRDVDNRNDKKEALKKTE